MRQGHVTSLLMPQEGTRHHGSSSPVAACTNRPVLPSCSSSSLASTPLAASCTLMGPCAEGAMPAAPAAPPAATAAQYCRGAGQCRGGLRARTCVQWLRRMWESVHQCTPPSRDRGRCKRASPRPHQQPGQPADMAAPGAATGGLCPKGGKERGSTHLGVHVCGHRPRVDGHQRYALWLKLHGQQLCRHVSRRLAEPGRGESTGRRGGVGGSVSRGLGARVRR